MSPEAGRSSRATGLGAKRKEGGNMAYGFSCKNCGHEEVVHRLAFDGDDRCHVCKASNYNVCAKKVHRGYRASLASCPGFEYSKKDKKQVIQSYANEPIAASSLPDSWIQQAKKIQAKKAMVRWSDLRGIPGLTC